MAASAFVWEVPPSVLAKNTAAYAKKLYAGIVALAQYFAAKMESYAKANAPWTDRTGHARQSLVAVAIPTAAAVTIVLAGLADYQIWLEVAHGGVWGIILKTVQAHYGEIAAALRRLAGGVAMAGNPTSAAAVLSRLKADAALVAVLPGGIYDHELKRAGPGATPDAYAPDPPYQPRPAAVVVDDGEGDALVGVTGTLLGFVSLWCYAPHHANGVAAIADAFDRARRLLVGWHFATGNGTGAVIEQAGQRLGVRSDPVDEQRYVDRLRFAVASYWPA